MYIFKGFHILFLPVSETPNLKLLEDRNVFSHFFFLNSAPAVFRIKHNPELQNYKIISICVKETASNFTITEKWLSCSSTSKLYFRMFQLIRNV